MYAVLKMYIPVLNKLKSALIKPDVGLTEQIKPDVRLTEQIKIRSNQTRRGTY